MTYEIFYATGGHSGPYKYPDALARSVLMVGGGERKVYIRERTKEGLGGYGSVVTIVRKSEEDESVIIGDASNSDVPPGLRRLWGN